MIQLITADRYGVFFGDIAEMHRLRYRIFKERLGWGVQVSGDMEIDEFDACRPVYLLQRTEDRAYRAVCGSCRRPAQRCFATRSRRSWTDRLRRHLFVWKPRSATLTDVDDAVELIVARV